MQTYDSIDTYIAQQPAAVQPLLEAVRAAIKEIAPDATECIAYGIPTFKLNGNLVHFAGFKNHIGFYPGAAGVATFATELTAYTTSKGTIQFPLDAPLPLPLIRRITAFRVEQQLQKKKKR